jgi:hypothetical protein
MEVIAYKREDVEIGVLELSECAVRKLLCAFLNSAILVPRSPQELEHFNNYSITSEMMT